MSLLFLIELCEHGHNPDRCDVCSPNWQEEEENELKSMRRWAKKRGLYKEEAKQ